MLVASRRPSKSWTKALDFARPLTLSSAPLYELILWVDPRAETPLPQEAEQDQHALLRDYPALFSAGGCVERYLERLHRHTQLPVAVGFGVKTPEEARAIARVADGVVVGSAIVNTIAGSLDENGAATAATVEAPLALVRALAAGVRAGRSEAA